MKIAIVTVYDSVVNFGSFLQAYAMSKVLESRGHEVFFVRRMPNDEILNDLIDWLKYKIVFLLKRE